MAEPAIRIDKWLWHARVVKTRTLARKLVEAGKIRVNREKISTPSRLVKPADVLTIVLERKILVYEIAAIANRRESFAVASKLYRDLSEPQQTTSSGTENGDTPVSKRPDSRQRKQLARLRGKIN